jgi:hypothetical protein
MRNVWLALFVLGGPLGCAYRGPTSTAVAAAHVQWSRQGHDDAYRCDASGQRIGRRRFAVSCAARTTYVTCLMKCCVALSGNSVLAEVPGENPTVCDERR